VDESPLIEFEEEGMERVLIAEEQVEEEMHHQPLEYNKWLLATQCIFGPLFCVVVLFSESGWDTRSLNSADIFCCPRSNEILADYSCACGWCLNRYTRRRRRRKWCTS
jgi:hypothetical protein